MLGETRETLAEMVVSAAVQGRAQTMSLETSKVLCGTDGT